MSIIEHKKRHRSNSAGAAVTDAAQSGGQLLREAALAGTGSAAAGKGDDSDSPESPGASADELSSGEAGAHISGDAPDGGAESSDSAESAGLSGDDEAGDSGEARADLIRGQGGAGAPVRDRQAIAGHKRKGLGGLEDTDGADDGTAFSDGDEAPLMSPEGVAAATAGLDEPSSEDNDDSEELDGGGNGTSSRAALGGMLAEADDSGDDSDAEDDERQGGNAGAGEDAGAFKNSAKGAAVARAFARIMEKTRPDGVGAGILSKSKSVAKRKRDEKAERTVDVEARQLRQEMKRRGHMTVPKRGEGPEQDVREKMLMKVAQRGVVRLFNAVSSAQKQQLEESVVGKRAKGTTLSKAGFLAELQGGPSTASGMPNAGSGIGGKLAVPIGGFGAGISAVSAAAAAADETAPPAWDVLKDDYTGLQTGSKMKDWDKRNDSDDAPAQEVFNDPAQSDSDNNAW